LLRAGRAKREEESVNSEAKCFSSFTVDQWLLPDGSFHLITLSARASTFCGIITPICFAVLRLMTSSNFLGCSTGRSAGLAPLRILST
jgi:hypothetical protein